MDELPCSTQYFEANSGSFSRLIKDWDFHDKKMAQKPVLKTVERGTGQREVRPAWNNAIRINHQNSNSRRNFSPTTVLTKSGIVPVSTARQSSSKTAAPGKSVTSAVWKQGINVVKSSTCWVWRPKIKVQDHVSKNSRSYICKRFDYVDPEGRLNDARTPQQNRLAKRKNRTIIEAAKTMLEDSLLPIRFWAEAANVACYVENRVLVTKPHNKTPYELLIGRAPIISFMRPFGCPVTILNTLDHKGKFNGKADEGFLVGYSINNKAFRVYNSRTKKVEENLHVNFLENKLNVTRSGFEWVFDIDSLTNSMNYQPVSARNRTNCIAGSKIHSDAGQKGKEKVSDQEYILLHVLNTSLDVSSRNEEVMSSPKDDADKKSTIEPTCIERGKNYDLGCLDQQMKSTNDSENTNSTNSFNTASPTVNTASDKDGTFQKTYGEWNFSTPINATGFSFSHPAALDDSLRCQTWKTLTLVDLPHRKRAIGTTWVYKNKRDQRRIVVRNKARLVAQVHRQEEGIDYDEVFAHVARIKAIRLFLAYASFMDFVVYQIDVKSAFLYGTIEEEVYVSQPPGFVDPKFPDRVYKVEKALYGLHQAHRAWYETLSNYLLDNGFRRRIVDKTLFIKKIKDDILLVEMYVDGIIFGSTKSVKSACTPMETHKPLSKDSDGTDIKIHVDNESAICVVKNPIYHLKKKHIEIRHHFIRESYDKRIECKSGQVMKIGIELKGYLLNAGYVSLCLELLVFSVLDFINTTNGHQSPCLTDKKELAIPGQMTTGKEFSNPLMAGRLPKTISAKVSAASTNLVLLA
nr:putative ribonuclease H-like domain-containing protein [Tanacetum cinerariifolium]